MKKINSKLVRNINETIGLVKLLPDSTCNYKGQTGEVEQYANIPLTYSLYIIFVGTPN